MEELLQNILSLMAVILTQLLTIPIIRPVTIVKNDY